MQNGSIEDGLRFRRLRGVDGAPGRFVRLDWGDRVRAAAQAAAGLQHLHTHAPGPLVHGGLQPSNILVAEGQGRKSFHLSDCCLAAVATSTQA